MRHVDIAVFVNFLSVLKISSKLIVLLLLYVLF